MKKNIYIVLLLSCISFLLPAQIGINTENPVALLHIDGQRNTSGSSNISDDVVVTSAGNIGIGTLLPTAKMHINTAATSAMRIVDGTQGNMKILRSDANGNTSWIAQASSCGIIHNITGGATYANGTTSLVKAMPISETGNYLVIIRWWGTATKANAGSEISAYFFLDESPNTSTARGTLKDGIEYYTNSLPNNAFCLTTSLFATATAGNYLKVFISPSIGGGDWRIGTVGNNYLWNPSIILFKI